MIEQELDKIRKQMTDGLENILPDAVLSKFVLGPSKMIRSRLCLLYLLCNNCKINDIIIGLCATAELIHNASLLHDDVIDDAKIRRNRTTISEQFTPKISILCGDYLVSKAIEKLSSLNNAEISNIFNKCVQNMAKAEVKQYFTRGKVPFVDDYIDICKGKTASLFSSVIESCAIVCDLSAQKAKNFGEVFGIAFQIKNDMKDSSIEQDKQNKINTVVDILGVEKSNDLLDNYKRELNNLINELPENEYREGLKDLVEGL